MAKQEKAGMRCTSCGSEKQREFGAEMNIHFPGREGRDKPVVWVFPKIFVCFNCGTTVFALPEAELRILEASASE
jgi:DNA-directed RNA polymerase subunit RPC12/RpoP